LDKSSIGKIEGYNASSIPILFEMCRIAKIAETVNDMVTWRADNSKISPGFLIETLIVSIIHARKPLWKLEEYWSKQKLEFMLSDSDITAEQLNDDAYGRALDKLTKVNMKEMISRVCLTMLQAHDLPIEILHFDTTSISVEGMYEQETEGEFSINLGHSKDHRPDLKQFKIGAAVQQNGLPMMGQLLSGNTSDKEWNPEAVVEAKEFFDKQQYKDIIFIGDSATVSSYEALQQLKGIQYISRFPETFACVTQWKEEAWHGANWQDVGQISISPRENTAHYRVCSFREPIEENMHRFILVHSTALRKQKEKTLQKRWDKEKQALLKESDRLLKKGFACAEDALRESASFVEKVEEGHYPIEAQLEERVKRSYSKRGKPKKGDTYQETISYHVSHVIGDRDSMYCEKDLFMASTFVLITSLLNESLYSNEFILTEYKQQNSIEQAFRFLKSPVYLGPVYLKTVERVEALGYVFILVLLIASYLEYRVRKSLSDNDEYLPQPGGQKARRPSTKTILELLETVLVYHFEGDLILPDATSPIIFKLLKWIGFEPDVYTKKLNVIF
jgi:transposase